jgi:hypothetical protein
MAHRSDSATPVSSNAQTSQVSARKVRLTLPTSHATQAQQSSSTNVTAGKKLHNHHHVQRTDLANRV